MIASSQGLIRVYNAQYVLTLFNVWKHLYHITHPKKKLPKHRNQNLYILSDIQSDGAGRWCSIVKNKTTTLWLCQNSFGTWPFIVGFPINSMMNFDRYVTMWTFTRGWIWSLPCFKKSVAHWTIQRADRKHGTIFLCFASLRRQCVPTPSATGLVCICRQGMLDARPSKTISWFINPMNTAGWWFDYWE